MKPEQPGAAFFAWSRSRPNLVEAGAGVGSGTSDFRGRSHQKKFASATLVRGLFVGCWGRRGWRKITGLGITEKYELL